MASCGVIALTTPPRAMTAGHCRRQTTGHDTGPEAQRVDQRGAAVAPQLEAVELAHEASAWNAVAVPVGLAVTVTDS
jgi:hypothetical protein